MKKKIWKLVFRKKKCNIYNFEIKKNLISLFFPKFFNFNSFFYDF